MNPQHVRLVLSNKNRQFNILSPGTHQYKCGDQVPQQQQSFSSIQVFQTIKPSSTVSSPTTLFLKSPATIFNFSNEITAQKMNKPTTATPVFKNCVNPSSCNDTPSLTYSTVEAPAATATCSISTASDVKSTSSNSNLKSQFLCHEAAQHRTKINKRQIKHVETTPKVAKRSKNWIESETITFIKIWSDFYGKLNAGGQRNTPIYNQMAQELNSILRDRNQSGVYVKYKISNLTLEYRRKKKEQGKTGASPSTWPYFEEMEKLLGKLNLLHCT
ncbi:unnamed protein product [Rotaria sp. Silwood1]|nr:unnamed protein product [Rotaria sp. Silwood1]